MSDSNHQRQSGDQALNRHQLIQTPHLDAIIDRMDARLQVLAGTRDRREHFLLMYRTFKNELRTSIRLGRFVDAEWAEAICCRMAEMYFEAEEAYASDRQACPIPWAHCFDSAVAGQTNLLQNMLLGMNAHINYDLPLCTYDVLLEFRDLDVPTIVGRHAQLVFDITLKRRYLDFLLINQVAWESIPLLQDTLLNRFSRLLKLGNILSMRFSKFAAEKVIVDYRDRAWGHTLLLATMHSPEEVTTVNNLTTGFAMEAASLVARLTLNPVKFIQALRTMRVVAADDRRHSAVVGLLVTRLKSHPTTRVARRALIEYGSAIHPILEQLLDENPRDADLHIELYKVMMRHPTPMVARALFNRLDPDDPISYDPALSHLARLHNQGIRFAFAEQRIRAYVEQELMRAKQYLDDYHTLGSGGSGALLGEALGSRFATAVRRVLYLSSLLHSDQALLSAAASVTQAWAQTAPDAVVSLLEQTLPQPEASRALVLLGVTGGSNPNPNGTLASQDAATRKARLAELARTGDPWLRVCALHQMAEPPLQENEMLSTIEKVLYLKACELFREVPSEDLAQVAGLARSYRFKRGEKLIEEGQPGMALYVILDGAVDVIVGNDRQVARIGRHAVLGEMSLLSDMPCSATCTAVHHGRALRIDRTDFLPFLLDYPEIATALIQVLIQRLRDVNQRFMEHVPGVAADYIAMPGT